MRNFAQKYVSSQIKGGWDWRTPYSSGSGRRIFESLPGRLGFVLRKLVPHSVLADDGHIFLGFLRDGNLLISYSYTSQSTTLHTFKLSWWLFVPYRPLQLIREVRLFGDFEVNTVAPDKISLSFCEWPNDNSKVVVYGKVSQTLIPFSEYPECLISILSKPQLNNSCLDCRSSTMTCYTHNFALHTKFELMPPYPSFVPRISLAIDGALVVNTGDSIVVIVVNMASKSTEQQGKHLLFDSDRETNDSILVDSRNISVQNTPGQDLETSAERKSSSLKIETPLNSVQESLINHGLFSFPLYFSPSGNDMNSSVSLNGSLSESSTSRVINNSTTNFTESIVDEKNNSLPVSPDDSLSESSSRIFNSLTTNLSASTAKHDLISTEFHVSNKENNSSPLQTSRNDSSPETETSAQLNLRNQTQSPNSPNVSLSSPQHQSIDRRSIYSFKSSSVPESTCSSSSHFDRSHVDSISSIGQDILLNIPPPELTSVTDFGSVSCLSGLPSPSAAVIVHSDAQCFTFSIRRYGLTHSSSNPNSGNEIHAVEDEISLEYHSLLPLQVTLLERQNDTPTNLSLLGGSSTQHFSHTNFGRPEVIVKQLTLDIEGYIGETIRHMADWGSRYVSLSYYDLQIAEVCPETSSVLLIVFVLVRALTADKSSPRRKETSGKRSTSVFETSLTVSWNLTNGSYTTLHLSPLKKPIIKRQHYDRSSDPQHSCSWRTNSNGNGEDNDEPNPWSWYWRPVRDDLWSAVTGLQRFPESPLRSVRILDNHNVVNGGKTLPFLFDPHGTCAIVFMMLDCSTCD